MAPNILKHVRTGLLALAALGGASLAASAGPAGFVAAPALPADAALQPTKVGWICDRGSGPCRNSDTGVLRTREQIKGNPYAGMEGVAPDRSRSVRRGWDKDRHWDRNWGDGRHKKHYRRHRSGPSIVLGLGFGSGYYDDYYDDYYLPRRYIAPRRHVLRLSARHIAWCYDRWLSYRDWDNTYKPLRGKRRQCISPFS